MYNLKSPVHSQVVPQLNTPVYNYNNFVSEQEININANFLKIESGLPLSLKINNKSSVPIRNVTKFLLRDYRVDKIYLEQELTNKQTAPVFISFWNGDIEVDESFKNIPITVASELTDFSTNQSIVITINFNSASNFGSNLIGFKVLGMSFIIKEGNANTSPISQNSEFTKIEIVEANDNGVMFIDYGDVGSSVDKAVIRYIPSQKLILPPQIEIGLYREELVTGEYGQVIIIGEPIYH
ncbi:MAG: hypothetical protein GF317_19230 [Candidatus Lokiarchaeota archaeon]|nr:hypothetical protein [Candidatus Lokiarchaeota archaeon]